MPATGSRPRWSKSKQEKKKKDKEPKVIENPKKLLAMFGRRSSEAVRAFLTDVCSMKKPLVVKLSQRNDVLPFDDETPIEGLAERRDCSLFLVGAHQKKRPNNLTLGRTFDHHVLDMAELGIERYMSASCFEGNAGVEAPAVGEKPLVVFSGPEFESDHDMRKLRSLLLDAFRGPQPETVALAGVRHVVSFASLPGRKVLMSTHTLVLKKSGSKVPRVELAETGPRAELVLRRTRWASDDLARDALRFPGMHKAGKQKNVDTKALEGTFGTVHTARQDIRQLASSVRLPKALRKRSKPTLAFAETAAQQGAPAAAADAAEAAPAEKRQRAD